VIDDITITVGEGYISFNINPGVTMAKQEWTDKEGSTIEATVEACDVSISWDQGYTVGGRPYSESVWITAAQWPEVRDFIDQELGVEPKASRTLDRLLNFLEEDDGDVDG